MTARSFVHDRPRVGHHTPNPKTEARSPTNLGDHCRNCVSTGGFVLAGYEHRAFVPRCRSRDCVPRPVITSEVAIDLIPNDLRS
jgi:hypothetical protein